MVINVGVIVNKGFEKVAVAQVRGLLDGVRDIVVDDTIVMCGIDDWNSVYRLIYRNQIANRVIYFIDKIEYSDNEGLFSKIRSKISKGFDDELLKGVITGGADFRVSMRADEHTDVTWLEAEVGGILIDYAKMLGFDLRVNLKNPIMNLYIHVHNNVAYLGIDLSGDLSKRDYKIFNNAISLKGPTAFGLLMLAGYNPKDVYINLCCYSGILEIEAALYAAGISHRYYNKSFPFMKFPSNTEKDWDKFFGKIDSERVGGKEGKFSITGSDKLLSSITASVKNAKIAGVEAYIDFRRIDLDWVDIKFEEKSVDKMITFTPGSSKHDKNLAKDFKQLFYQAEYILKDSGTVVMMCLSKELLIEASKEYFNVDHETTVHSGSLIMHVLFFKKKNGK
jgi:23S rRNA G2445 N2-methylase RlmL